ncbi:MAG: hypothetical protein ACLTBB_04435 [Roseburia hominis]
MARMHWWIMAVGAVFFLWFFIPAFVVVNIGNITGMAVSALVLLYGIFYRQVQDVAGRLWQTRGGRAGLSALGMVLLFILLIVTVDGGDDKKRGKPCAGEYDGGGLRMQRQGGAAEPGVERTALRGV